MIKLKKVLLWFGLITKFEDHFVSVRDHGIGNKIFYKNFEKLGKKMYF